MTSIARRMAKGYAVLSAVCLALVAWLAYHEFVEEPAEFAAKGYTDIHKDTEAEFSTVLFLAAVPVLLGFIWWWMFRVLSPLKALLAAVEKVDEHNLLHPLPRSMKDDEVDKLSAAFSAMAMRLDKSFRRIHEFTLHASHELKTPLTVMRAQLETVLRENGSLPAAQAEWVESLLDEVQRLAKIVDSLTLLTKADAGLVTLERQSVSFGELVQEAFEDALILAPPQQVRVTLEACAAAPLTGDRHRLRQLLLILVDNAVKYNQPNGEIQISLREQDGTAELRITNDGGGITAETQRRLFSRFVRGENAMGKVEGCGLGLTIAQWIVQAHGGSIELRTEPGKRTTALVRLPLAHSTQPVLAENPIAV
ncbi:MAG: HAMP domain-containing sensor histidine kinase [Chthoniobacteraceae bacterium]